MSPITTQNNWSLRKEIFDYLVGQIENGQLKPGAFINVRRLTEELNVSRTPLREALAQMEVQGLVTIMPQRGVLINVLTYDDLLGLFEIIGALESQAVMTVFDRISNAKINAMERCNRKMFKAIEKGKNREFHETNIHLHKIFLDLSPNRELTIYVGNLKLRLFGFALKSYRDRFKRAIVEEHDVFLKLLKAGEGKAASDYLKDVHWKFNHPENFIRPDTVNNGKPGNN